MIIGKGFFLCDETIQMAVDAQYYTLLSKFFDLIETVVFVLRKNFRQVSVLHVYHHVGTIFTAFLAFLLFPGNVYSCFTIYLYKTILLY